MGYLNYGNAGQTCNTQYATAYATYLIVEQYYHGCTFVNEWKASTFLMHYKSLKEDKQFQLEERIDKIIGENLPEIDMKDAFIQTYEKDNLLILSIKKDNNTVNIYIDIKGNVSLTKPETKVHDKNTKRRKHG